ncbi:MAG: hypothetical protein M3Y91_18200 [Actinomycetota bacterium]|nr:hypothetical protein [Actinomycetota bacterium]
MRTATTSTQPCLLSELASGIDALYLSGRGQLRPGLTVRPHGWGRYRYCIDHWTARIGLTTSSHLPPVRIQPRSEYLHGIGPTKAVGCLAEPLRESR